MKDIINKLKGVLNAEDFGSIESALKTMVNEKVDIKVQDRVKELDMLAEEFTNKEVETKLEEAKEELIKEYDQKMEDLETNLVEKLDKFLDSEINENISDEMITKVALNETYEPIVEGIKSLFEEKFVALDTEGHGILKEAKEELEKKDEELSVLISEKMELKEALEQARTKSVILEKVEGLTESQKERVNNFFDGKDFSETSEKIESFVSMVKESEEEENEENLNENEDVDSGLDDKEAEKTSDKIEEEKQDGNIDRLL